MLHRILVPLDGTDFAEAALPYAEVLARRTGATVHLVRASIVAIRPAYRTSSRHVSGACAGACAPASTKNAAASTRAFLISRSVRL